MPALKIQVGQVWKKDGTGEEFLVTKVYSEALATYAMLRQPGSEGDARLRVRVERNSGGQTLPGFVYAQQTDQF
jgi:hypothetical protein